MRHLGTEEELFSMQAVCSDEWRSEGVVTEWLSGSEIEEERE
jgi:hypothetical protein